ncbi:MAG TPA: YihY/virulence factor BrkB family protein [Pyrinomonadaceae bacterium]|nr:YihY/virulence factor BrkB family protein [Pyrinomonadaceae bacterium]
MILLPKINWKHFFSRLYHKILDTDVFNRAAQCGFYFSFAFFPLLFFLISLFGLVLVSTEGLKHELFVYLHEIMPRSAFDLVQKTLSEIIDNSSGGKLTLGLLVTLWSASAGIDSLRSSLNAVYQLREGRSWWHTKLQSLVLTLLFIILVAVVLAGVAYGWKLVQLSLGYIGFEVTSPFILVAIQWITILVVMLLVTEVVFSWVPCFDKFRWVWISPGAIVSMVLWVILTTGFRFYLQYFNTYDKAYGSLGAVIILMLWMYLTAMAVLVGGVINSVLGEMNKPEGEATPGQDIFGDAKKQAED